MAFLPETNVFTDSGWKEIQNIAGSDKVLIRNFLGDAEFIQPFALKRINYDGEIVKLSGQYRSFTFTADHTIVYEITTSKYSRPTIKTTAKEFIPGQYHAISRKFKFIATDKYVKEQVTVRSNGTKVLRTFDTNDWYTFAAYMVCRGDVKVTKNQKFITIQLRADTAPRDTEIIGGILDRLGITWSVMNIEQRNQSYIRVSSKNTLANLVRKRLGSQNRKDMFLPDKMIYNATKELANTFVTTLTSISIGVNTKRTYYYQYATNNEKLVDSLMLFGIIWGHGINKKLMAKKGTERQYGVISKDVYTMTIHDEVKAYFPVHKTIETYSGFVYSLDIFDGNVYIKGGSIPVWLSPK